MIKVLNGKSNGRNLIPVKHFKLSMNLGYTVKKNFHSPNGLFEKPTQNLFSHLLIFSNFEIIEYFRFNQDLSWTLSIALTGSIIRLLQIPTFWLIKDMKFGKILPGRLNNFIFNWYDKLVLNDFLIDMKRNKINKEDSQRILYKFYNPNVIFSYIPQIFLLFNNFRALNSMSRSSLDASLNISANSHQYLDLTLASHDPYFILPLLIMVNNYLLLNIIKHPWLINYHNDPKKHIRLLYISFFSSLFTVFWPKAYIVSWIAYSMTHIVINILSNYFYEYKKLKLSYSYHVDKNYKDKMENLIKNINNK